MRPEKKEEEGPDQRKGTENRRKGRKACERWKRRYWKDG
jgi:hypothetical protein